MKSPDPNHETMIDELQHATVDLSVRLGEAYDQIDFLFQLGRSMCALDTPELFFRSVITQLHTISPFGWVAFRIIKSAPALPGMLTVAGDTPIDHDAISEEADELLATMTGEMIVKIIQPDRHRFAKRCGSQLIAEPLMINDEFVGCILCGGKGGVDPEIDSRDLKLMDAAVGFINSYYKTVVQFIEIQQTFTGTVRAMSAAIDAKDAYTRGHSERVGVLSRATAMALGFAEEDAERLYIAGLVHDVGKIGVPEATLQKPGRLTDEEFEQIKRHPQIGFDILKDIGPMHDILPAVLHHHERWDGDGYPYGLAGEDIPFLGRLLAVGDAFDAMSSDRSYRAGMQRTKVLSILRDGAGTQWDASVVEAFLTVDLAEYDRMIRTHARQSSRAA